MSRRSAAASPPPPSPERVGALRRALLAHYDRTARALPWRGETDPYRVWVSEVMLQQTRVETVLGYYGPWLARFPDVDALASAELDQVLLAWEGLGYYRRARNLHDGARLVREKYGGSVPSDYHDLRELPGLGEYAAGAVASIAFGQPVPAVDGNVRRVFARLFDVADPRPKWLRDMGMALVDPGRPGDWNQALMDLGATICVPGTPRCGACPLVEWCAARAAGTQEVRPAPPKRKEVPAATFASAVVVDDAGRAFVGRRPEGGLLAGMWSFPDAEVGAAESDAEESGVVRSGAGGDRDASAVARSAAKAAEEAGASVDLGGAAKVVLRPVRHRFTHLDATYHPVMFRVSGPVAEAFPPDRRWVALDTPGVPLPVAQQKIARAASAELARGSANGPTNEPGT